MYFNGPSMFDRFKEEKALKEALEQGSFGPSDNARNNNGNGLNGGQSHTQHTEQHLASMSF